MEQNQPTDNQTLDQTTNNDLQKAIDDITNTTNVDPVFSDPVATPSVPDNNIEGLNESIESFSETKLDAPLPPTEPAAPINPTDLPDLGAPAPAPAPTSTPTITPPSEAMPNAMSEPPTPEATNQETEPTPTPEPTPETAPNIPTENLNVQQIKKAALHDLVPLLNHLDMNPSQKFNLYRSIFEDLKDYSVLESAYHAAAEISDEKERAEALLYLVESIDKI